MLGGPGRQRLGQNRAQAAEAGKSMLRGWARRAAQARQVGSFRGWGSIGVLTLGLVASGCVGGGQIANLVESRDPTVAFEAIDGPPSAIVQKLVKSLEQEAGARRVALASSSEANYRLRGYLAAHAEDGTTAISWTLEAYDADQRRAFRLSGEEKASGHLWAAVNDQTLQRIARTSMQQFVALAAAQSGPTPVVTGAPLPSLLSTGWFDDWTPEASGIFRIFQREPARPEIAADAEPPLPPDQVPLPRARPAPSPVPSGTAFAFASEDH
jgi:hypothetical protein